MKKAKNKTDEAQRIKGIKGFDRDLKCRGMQYELAKTFTHDGEVSLCNSGLHFVTDPLDVFSYYAPTQRFAEVEAEEVAEGKDGDSKRVAKTLHIGAEISLRSLVDMGVKFALDKVDFSSADGESVSKGNSSTAASSGYSSTAASSGYSSKAASSGDYSTAASSGDYSKATAAGINTIAMVAGCGGSASAGENGCFALAWWDGTRNRIVVGYVGENGIEADVLYRVKDGKLVKAQ